MRYVSIDGNRLKEDLINYFGTAMSVELPLAMIDLERVQSAWGDELIEIALENGFDLSKYEE